MYALTLTVIGCAIAGCGENLLDRSDETIELLRSCQVLATRVPAEALLATMEGIATFPDDEEAREELSRLVRALRLLLKQEGPRA